MNQEQINYDKEAPYEAEIVADSISKYGHRLTSMEVNFPRMILSEFNTHRLFSRNSASSRARPTNKPLFEVLTGPYIPLEWGKYMPGMSSREEMSPENQELAEKIWLEFRDRAVLGTVALLGGVDGEQIEKNQELKDRIEHLTKEYSFNFEPLEGESLHKQWVNRLLEPYLWHRVIVTSTEWDNFFGLRISEHAQPEIKRIAELMLSAYQNSEPTELAAGEYHTPFMLEDEADLDQTSRLKISSARSGRISYMTHHGVRDTKEDIRFHDQLVANGHMSPLEHVATPFNDRDMLAVRRIKTGDFPAWLKREADFNGNFRGWHQYRKSVPQEGNFALRPESQYRSEA